MTEGSDPDWVAIRHAVEDGAESLEAIAARFDVKRSTISMRKFRGGWMSPQDIAKLMKVEEGLDSLAAAMMRRLKQSAKHGDQLNARAKELIHAQCGDEQVLARLEIHVKALNDMSPVLRMTADLTRLMERKARASADLRAAHAALEAQHDRPDFIAFERAVLARIAAEITEEDMECVDAGGAAAARDILGGAEEPCADAA